MDKRKGIIAFGIVVLLVALLSLPATMREFPARLVLRGFDGNGAPDSTTVVSVSRAEPTGRWVVHYDPQTPLQEKLEYIERIGGTVVERIVMEEDENWVVEVPAGFDNRSLTFDSDVELVEQDFVVGVAAELPAGQGGEQAGEAGTAYLGLTGQDIAGGADFDIPPKDPDYGLQWALPHIQAEQAWGEMGELAGKTVAVIDTGVCGNHEDLQGRVLDNGYDFVDDDDDPDDIFGHGCSVAGIIAANIDNGIGIAGFAPNAAILPVRVLGRGGSGSMADVAAGIVYAADNGADIINLSLGSAVGSQLTREAVEHAIEKGLTVIASAGNSGGSLPGYPARYEGVVAVGAIDEGGSRSSFSNRGGDIWAPGRDVHTIYLDDSYKKLNGTSFSAPYVAAMAAVLEGMGEEIEHLDGGDMTWTCMRDGGCAEVPGS